MIFNGFNNHWKQIKWKNKKRKWNWSTFNAVWLIFLFSALATSCAGVLASFYCCPTWPLTIDKYISVLQHNFVLFLYIFLSHFGSSSCCLTGEMNKKKSEERKFQTVELLQNLMIMLFFLPPLPVFILLPQSSPFTRFLFLFCFLLYIVCVWMDGAAQMWIQHRKRVVHEWKALNQ